MNTAAQCRRRGINVGDTIIGRETYYDGRWHDAELTLLWIGKRIAVWSVRTRTDRRERWSRAEECASWTLELRKWHKVKP